MADLSVAQCAALAQLIEHVPDGTLQKLTLAVKGMRGDRARALEAMLAEAARDRARRQRGLGALAPMFRPRPDGVAAMSFPPQVLSRLWRTASAGQGDLLTLLDPCDVYREDTYRFAMVCTRLYAAAAAAVRDRPDEVWPAAPGGREADREAALAALAHACDLGGLALRALPSLQAWVGRPDANEIAELRLLLRDATEISADGARELLEILFAHLADAPLVLRLVVNASHACARDSFLRGSELATFMDRLIEAAEVRAARIAAYGDGEPVEPLRADLGWIAEFLAETDATLQIESESPWGKRIREIRTQVSETLGALLGRVEKMADRALPMTRVRTAGRMRREKPGLSAPIERAAVERAQFGLDLVRATRSLTGAFGCDAQRQGLVADLTTKLITYADLGLEEINAGEVADMGLATERVKVAADFLQRIEMVAEARAVRRRVAAAGLSAQGVSPKAA